MTTISRCYSRICTQKYRAIGFFKRRTTFARIRGDVIQTFSLKLSRRVPACSIEFGVFPLCLPQPIFLDAGGYALDEFIIEKHEDIGEWTFDHSSDKSMIYCIESLSKTIDLYLLPFFDVCDDCNSALPELIKLEELFDGNRQTRLQLRGDFDSALNWQERSLFDSRKYFMALKSRNLSYAYQYLNYQINFCKMKLEALDNPNASIQPDIVRERFSIRLAMHLEHLERLQSGKLGYFDALLNANENQMKKFLSTQYPKIFSGK